MRKGSKHHIPLLLDWKVCVFPMLPEFHPKCLFCVCLCIYMCKHQPVLGAHAPLLPCAWRSTLFPMPQATTTSSIKQEPRSPFMTIEFQCRINAKRDPNSPSPVSVCVLSGTQNAVGAQTITQNIHVLLCNLAKWKSYPGKHCTKSNHLP